MPVETRRQANRARINVEVEDSRRKILKFVDPTIDYFATQAMFEKIIEAPRNQTAWFNYGRDKNEERKQIEWESLQYDGCAPCDIQSDMEEIIADKKEC